MRHHFTKSERLALQVIAALHLDFTEMESTAIQKGGWARATTTMQNIRMRHVERIVTFTVDDKFSTKHAGVQVLLKGTETETRHADSISAETTWKVDQILTGHRSDEGIEWHEFETKDLPGLPQHLQFPRYLLESSRAVASADA